jgi:tRNA 2-thiouridine synthesizing protein A
MNAEPVEATSAALTFRSAAGSRSMNGRSSRRGVPRPIMTGRRLFCQRLMSAFFDVDQCRTDCPRRGTTAETDWQRHPRPMPQTKLLNLTGLKCPHVAVAAKRALQPMARGEVLEVNCNDPMAAIDLPALALQLGHDFKIEDAVPGPFKVVITNVNTAPAADVVWPHVS